MVYPLKMCPIYKQYLWGGENLISLGKPLPFSQVGESWELSEHPSSISTIANGTQQGKTLTQVRNIWQEKLFGKAYATVPCPLLTKFLDATEQLSIQVHPTPEKGGKGEVWYIISAQPGAKIIYGLKPGTKKEEVLPVLGTKHLCSLLNEVPVSPGEVYYIPPGLIHSLGKGILAAEIQQKSDITYRLYDFDRKDPQEKPRPLHLQEGSACIHWQQNQNPTTNIYQTKETAHYQETIYQTTPSFHFSTLKIHKHITRQTTEEHFTVLVCIQGQGELIWPKGSLPIKQGDTFLLPAALGKYTIKNQLTTTLVLLTANPI